MTLHELLIDELQDLYDAEEQLVRGLRLFADAACGPALRAAFESHLQETHVQLTRLEDVFALLGTPPAAKPCSGIAGILHETSKRLDDSDLDHAVRDAALIAAAQKTEHYEIAGYGTAVAWARTIGLSQVVDQLEQSLEEEKLANQALSDLAVQEINISATHESA
jgi:ferritin-like metal-binding protein YciE